MAKFARLSRAGWPLDVNFPGEWRGRRPFLRSGRRPPFPGYGRGWNVPPQNHLILPSHAAPDVARPPSINAAAAAQRDAHKSGIHGLATWASYLGDFIYSYDTRRTDPVAPFAPPGQRIRRHNVAGRFAYGQTFQVDRSTVVDATALLEFQVTKATPKSARTTLNGNGKKPARAGKR